MSRLITLIFLFVPFIVYGQTEIDPSKLKTIAFTPGISINEKPHRNRVDFDSLMKYGFRVVLEDSSFNVVQFDVVYDCHSRSMIDFSVRRYAGDKILPTDQYFQKRTLAGDVMDIVNTVIDKKGYKYVMKPFTFLVEK